MQFVDLKTQQQKIRVELDRRIAAVLDHGHYIMGPEVFELEAKLAQYVGVKHAVSCASGTDALLMALMAYGIGPGDAVFTTPFSFFATAEVVSMLGAMPVFVDIDPQTYNLDPEALEATASAFSEKSVPPSHPFLKVKSHRDLTPKAIIAVDLFGLPAEYDRINQIAQKYGLAVVEDAAQSFGALYRGRKAGSLGDVACTSFYPAKPLGAYGDGGMCFTNSDATAELLKSIRIHGMGQHQYDNVRIGINGRLDTLQAAILLAKFDIFPAEIKMRGQAAATYSRLLAGCSGVQLPLVKREFESVWAQYSLLAESQTHREATRQRLSAAGIPTAIYYPKPLHLQAAFGDLGYRAGDFPVSEDCAARIFSLPMHPYLSLAEQERIADLVNCET
jgi:UDP-2-acetamido-2-deoxy-ribo-hexuluronate aminotransferase